MRLTRLPPRQIEIDRMPSKDPPFKDHFSILAAGYSRYRPDYPVSLFRYLASLTPGKELAWDCATGSGQAAVTLADFFSTVIATNASSKQIEQACTHPSVEYRIATAEESGLESASVDLITVAQALHWFDIPRFMQEAERVLKPKGIIAVWTYNLFRITPEIDAVVDDLYWNVLDGYWAKEQKLVESGYADLELPFMEQSSPAFEMNTRWRLDRVIGYLGTWSAIGNYRKTHGGDLIADISARLNRAWGDAAQEREICWPLNLRVGVNK